MQNGPVSAWFGHGHGNLPSGHNRTISTKTTAEIRTMVNAVGMRRECSVMDPIFVPTIEATSAAWCRLRRVLFDYSAASTGCEVRSASPAWPCARRRPPLEFEREGHEWTTLNANDVEASLAVHYYPSVAISAAKQGKKEAPPQEGSGAGREGLRTGEGLKPRPAGATAAGPRGARGSVWLVY